MHAFGLTLRRSGDLALLVIPGADGPDCYCVVVGSAPLATFPAVQRAMAFFDALREASEATALEVAEAEAWAQEAERQRVHLEEDGCHQPAPSRVTDLAMYRLQRASRRGARQPRPNEPRPTERWPGEMDPSSHRR